MGDAEPGAVAIERRNIDEEQAGDLRESWDGRGPARARRRREAERDAMAAVVAFRELRKGLIPGFAAARRSTKQRDSLVEPRRGRSGESQ